MTTQKINHGVQNSENVRDSEANILSFRLFVVVIVGHSTPPRDM